VTSVVQGPWEPNQLNAVDKGKEPPDPPDMELKLRVARLEDDAKEIKAAVARMEPIIIRIDTMMQHIATKASVDALTEKVGGLDKRLGLTEGTVASKIIGGWGIVAILGALIAIPAALNNLSNGRAAWQFTAPQTQQTNPAASHR
jgi:hypothetical protein